MAKIKIKESEIQKVILDYLQIQENMGKLLFQRSNSLNVATKDGHYIKTGKRGSPDILVFIGGIFSSPDYYFEYTRTIALEVKSENGKLSNNQVEWKNNFENIAHGEYYIVKSLEDVLEALKE